MQFKTAQQIRAEREAAQKNATAKARRKEKLAEKAILKYARMAEETAKREAARKAQAPKLVVNRENVIIAPVLAEQKPEPETRRKRERERRSGAPSMPESLPKANAKQVWDEATKSWVKLR